MISLMNLVQKIPKNMKAVATDGNPEEGMSLKAGLRMGAANALSNLGQSMQAPSTQFDQNLGRGGMIYPPAQIPPPLVAPNVQYGNSFASYRKSPPMGHLPALNQPFGGFRAAGGRMYPGYNYQVGNEQVQMNPDGTAMVIPGDDIENQAKIEQAAKARQGQSWPSMPPPALNRAEVPPLPAGASPDPGYGWNDDIAAQENGLTAPQLQISPEVMAPPPSLYDQKRAAVNALIKRGEQHVSKGASTLSYLFQGMEQFGNNMMGRANNQVVPLGQQRYQRELGKAQAELAPLEQQRQYDTEAQKNQAQANKFQAESLEALSKAGEAGKTSYDYKQDPNTKQWYAAPKGTTDYRPVDSIPSLKMVRAQVPGTPDWVDIPEDVYYQEANKREVANITNEGKAVTEVPKIKKGNYVSQAEYDKQVAERDLKVANLTDDGISLYNQGQKKREEAKTIRAQIAAKQNSSDPMERLLGDKSEVKRLEAEARKLEEEGNKFIEEGKKKNQEALNLKKVKITKPYKESENVPVTKYPPPVTKPMMMPPAQFTPQNTPPITSERLEKIFQVIGATTPEQKQKVVEEYKSRGFKFQ